MHDRARGRQGDRQTRVGYPVTGAYLYSKMENKYKRSNSIPTYYYYLLYWLNDKTILHDDHPRRV